MNWNPKPFPAGKIVREKNQFRFIKAESNNGKRDGGEFENTVYEWRIGKKKIYVGHTGDKVKYRHTKGGQHITSLNDAKKPRRKRVIDLMNSHGLNEIKVYAYDLSTITVSFFNQVVTPREAFERALREREQGLRGKHAPELNRTRSR